MNSTLKKWGTFNYRQISFDTSQRRLQFCKFLQTDQGKHETRMMILSASPNFCKGISKASMFYQKIKFIEATIQGLVHLLGQKPLFSQTPSTYLSVFFLISLSGKGTYYGTENSNQFIQSTKWLYLNRQKAAYRL